MNTATKQGLCSMAKGEERGVGLLIQLQKFAPTKNAKEQINLQIEDERRHAAIFAGVLSKAGVDCESMQRQLGELYDLAQEYVDKKCWVECIAIQAVIEELAMSAFIFRYPSLAPASQAELESVILDERRHLDFCIQELSQYTDTESLQKISELHNRVVQIVKKALMVVSAADRPELIHILKMATTMHKQRLLKLNIPIPTIVFPS